MQRKSDNSPQNPDADVHEKNIHDVSWRDRSLRKGVLARSRNKAKLKNGPGRPEKMRTPHERGGFDPELLYVECGRCGAPVLWEPGRASRLLMEAGIDPLELDASCILVTDACPACGDKSEYSVRIFRITDAGTPNIPPLRGRC